MPTIADVAKACGLSPATVSLVINNSTMQVSSKTRAKVKRVVEEMQYRPSAHARRLSTRRANTIGVVTKRQAHLLADIYYGMLIDSIVDCAADLDQTVAIYNGRIWENENRTQLKFADGRCDGVLLLYAEDDPELIQALHEAHVPFVRVNSAYHTAGVNSVDIDDVDAGFKMTSYLIGLGHRRIACLRTADHFSTERLLGYKKAMENTGLEFDERLVFTGAYGSEETGYVMAQNVIRDAALGVTAIFAVTDALACDAVQGAKDLGLRVPDDISVVGINDTMDAARCNPPLTTLRQSVEDIGATALRLLLQVIDTPEADARHIILSTEVVVRASAARPHASGLSGTQPQI